MLFEKHLNFNENGEIIEERKEIENEILYDVLKRKKGKLITEIKTEKIINPELQRVADEAIETIEKAKTATGNVGDVSYYYSFLKGYYFYIHKKINREGSYVESIHYYSVSLANKTLFEEIIKTDPLRKETKS